MSAAVSPAARASQVVLLTLATGQFLMTLDSSVMNVSIATVAEDVGTTVPASRARSPLYTLVMATLMITGGKIGAIIGRRRAFSIGCVIYGCGSFTTVARAEPARADVRLVGARGRRRRADHARDRRAGGAQLRAVERPRAYGLVAAAGAIAVAVGPLIGGLGTTYFSWRWVFAGEVLIVLAILVLAVGSRIPRPTEAAPRLVGAVLSALGLGLIVFGVLRSGGWGWVHRRRAARRGSGLADDLADRRRAGRDLAVLALGGEGRSLGRRAVGAPGVRARQLVGGLTMFFFQYLVQAGVFFVVPLYLSVVLG